MNDGNPNAVSTDVLIWLTATKNAVSWPVLCVCFKVAVAVVVGVRQNERKCATASGESFTPQEKIAIDLHHTSSAKSYI